MDNNWIKNGVMKEAYLLALRVLTPSKVYIPQIQSRGSCKLKKNYSLSSWLK